MSKKHVVERLVNMHARAPLHSTEAAVADDLTSRIRHPKRWTLRHPIRAGRRHKIAAALTLIGVAAAVLASMRGDSASARSL